MLNQIQQARWSQLSELVAQGIGLHFPQERWDDLKRGLVGAAQEFGFKDVSECADWLLSAPPSKARLQVLASHLTIGETYFFREKQTLDAFAKTILPELIRTRRGRDQRLRIWSAACCTGEEPYSLAILLHQALPDLQDWHVTINATDINRGFLRKAMSGTYGEWSFRDAPNGLKERYCNRAADGHLTIIPEIRKMVVFAHLNLVEDAFPSLVTDTNAMDIIFCRNVLMYFTPVQARKVIGNLYRALTEGGWLAVSPSEASKALFPQFTNVNFPGAILFQKGHLVPQAASSPLPPTQLSENMAQVIEKQFDRTPAQLVTTIPVPTLLKDGSITESPQPGVLSVADSLYREGRYEAVVDALLSVVSTYRIDLDAYSLLARALANLGRLGEALTCCDRWIATDKLDQAAHYLRAMVLLEMGSAGQARASLQRAIYLQPGFVLAHFASGNLEHSLGNTREAQRHFANALHLLSGYQTDDLLPESEGLTVGRITEFINSRTASESPQ